MCESSARICGVERVRDSVAIQMAKVGKSAFVKSSLIKKDLFGVNDSHNFDAKKIH
jgi:hypothetical protein